MKGLADFQGLSPLLPLNLFIYFCELPQHKIARNGGQSTFWMITPTVRDMAQPRETRLRFNRSPQSGQAYCCVTPRFSTPGATMGSTLSTLKMTADLDWLLYFIEKIGYLFFLIVSMSSMSVDSLILVR